MKSRIFKNPVFSIFIFIVLIFGAKIEAGNLIADWQLNESPPTISDSSGYGNHGTVFGAVFKDGVYEFYGDNEYIEISDNDILDLTEDFEITAKVKLSEKQVRKVIVSKWNDDANSFSMETRAGNLFFIVTDNQGEETAVNSKYTLETDQDYMLKASLKDDIIKIYVNDQLVQQVPYTQKVNITDTPVRIGGLAKNNPKSWEGAIDYVKIFSYLNEVPTVSLSAATISGKAPLSVNLQTEASDQDGWITLYEYDFDYDGITFAPDEQGENLTSVSHTYNAQGNYTAAVRVTDNGIPGEAVISTIGIEVLAPNIPPIAVISGEPTEGLIPLTVNLYGEDSYDLDGIIILYEWDFNYDGETFTIDDSGITSTISYTYETKGLYSAALRAKDNDGVYSSIAVLSDIDAYEFELPPDPELVANPINMTIATTILESTEFLYTGENPIQTGVAPGTIELKRVCVLRGTVFDKSNNPLPAVTLTIHNHPEYGSTLSRLDGKFDMAVNGGGELVIDYEREDYIPCQRHIDVPWQDYITLPDVVMIQRDTKVTEVDFTETVEYQVVTGSIVTDDDGIRQTTVIIPPGTTASIYDEFGNPQVVENLDIRFTEFSIGENGPETMPAELPPTSAYTYCVALEADEATIKIGGKDVLFNQPIPLYVENFLNFPVGTRVPTAFYDNDKAAWIPEPDGRVVGIVSETGGLADVDIDGDGLEDNSEALTELGITDAFREELANSYEPGQSIWWGQIEHFSWYDRNWPFMAPLNAVKSAGKYIIGLSSNVYNCFAELFSSIGIQSQTLGESIGINGTPFMLNYQSSRTAGYRNNYIQKIPLSDSSLPSSCIGIELEVQIAGKIIKESFPPDPDQSYTFEWDGKDIYGRKVQGKQAIKIRVGYVYPGYYMSPGAISDYISFGLSAADGVPIGSIRGENVTLWDEKVGFIGSWDAAYQQGLGGWTLNIHHGYDPTSKMLYLGDGSKREVETIGFIVETIAGGHPPNEYYGYSGDGGPSEEAKVAGPTGIDVASDGSIYFAGSYMLGSYNFIYNTIRQINPNGIIETVAGIPSSQCNYSGDGGPAIEAELCIPSDVAVDSEGNFYIAGGGNYIVRRVDTNGIITTFAGAGTTPLEFYGDGGPAIDARLKYPSSIDVGFEGSVYIYDSGNKRIRRVGPDGIIETIAGTGVTGHNGDGGPANEAEISGNKLAVGPDGSVYTNGSRCIQMIGNDGIIKTIAGTYNNNGYTGDGGPAVDALLGGVGDIAIGKDGTVYFIDRHPGKNVIRRITPDGIINTIAGGGSNSTAISSNGGFALQAGLVPNGIAIGPDNSIYITESTGAYSHRVRRLRKPLPGLDINDFIVASEDGSMVYLFDYTGRHLRTLDSLTGNTVLDFLYDGNGFLESITDINGNTTTINRFGNQIEIVAPFGQTTTLNIGADEYLASIANEAEESFECTYKTNGLLETFTKPRGYSSQFYYDSEGLLIRDEDAAGGFAELSGTQTYTGVEVTKTTAENHESTFSVEYLTTGEEIRTTTNFVSPFTEHIIGKDGSLTTTTADGTIITAKSSQDPRFGMQAGYMSSSTITTPGGITLSSSANRTVSLAVPNDLLSLETWKEEMVINGRTYTKFFNALENTITTWSPSGIKTVALLDNRGKMTQIIHSDFAPINYAFNLNGFLTNISQGSGVDERRYVLSYNSQGYLDKITDPISRIVQFEYNISGQVTKKILPDGREIVFDYDKNGNLTSIIPSGRPSHTFTYTNIDLQQLYIAPDVGESSNVTHYTYDLDKRLINIKRPDGKTIDYTYNDQGNVNSILIPRGQYSIIYDVNSGYVYTITAPDSSIISYAYDGVLVTSTSWYGEVNGSVSQTYSNDFNVSSYSVNGASTINYQYNSDLHLIQVGDLSILRNPNNGIITGTTIGDVTDSASINEFGEIINYNSKFNTTDLYSVYYSHDKLGRIKSKTEIIDAVTHTYEYQYDLSGRIEEVWKDGDRISKYEYDSNGNRLNYITPSLTVSGIYDDQDRLISYGNFQYTYNANGDITSRTNTLTNEIINYNYDVIGNLLSVTLPNNTEIEYIIDARNRRIGKKVNGTLIQGFLYQDQLNPIAELDGSENVKARFIYATKPNVPDYVIKDGQIYRFIVDNLGSPRLIVNVDTGEIAQRMDYDEFGNLKLDTNPGFQPFGFAGGIYDKDTGLVKFGARDYDSFTGRWTVKDPILFGGSSVNLYMYVLNDPINWKDSGGLTPFDIFKDVVDDCYKYSTCAGIAEEILIDTAIVTGIIPIIYGSVYFGILYAEEIMFWGGGLIYAGFEAVRWGISKILVLTYGMQKTLRVLLGGNTIRNIINAARGDRPPPRYEYEPAGGVIFFLPIENPRQRFDPLNPGPV